MVDRELYLPRSWTEDPDRCRAARIPEDKSFATKPELARAMIRRALDSTLPIAWVTADAAYGQEWHFRRMLEEADVGYVLAVPKSQQVKSPAGSWRIDHVLTGAPVEAWERISCGNGAKGPRVYDWAAAKLPTIDGSDPTHDRWVLARRSLARPEEIAYYLAFAQAHVTVSELVRVAGARWAIEECFQAAKNECGLDQAQPTDVLLDLLLLQQPLDRSQRDPHQHVCRTLPRRRRNTVHPGRGRRGPRAAARDDVERIARTIASNARLLERISRNPIRARPLERIRALSVLRRDVEVTWLSPSAPHTNRAPR